MLWNISSSISHGIAFSQGYSLIKYFISHGKALSVELARLMQSASPVCVNTLSRLTILMFLILPHAPQVLLTISPFIATAVEIRGFFRWVIFRPMSTATDDVHCQPIIAKLGLLYAHVCHRLVHLQSTLCLLSIATKQPNFRWTEKNTRSTLYLSRSHAWIQNRC